MQVEYSVISLGFRTSIDLEERDIISWFESISKSVPEFSVFSQDKDKRKYTLQIDETHVPDQNMIIAYLNDVTIAFGSNFDLNRRKLIVDKVFKDVENITKITPFKLMFVDYVGYFEVEYIGNHTALIKDVFFQGSPASKLFTEENQKLYTNDLKFRGLVGNDRIGIVEIQSGNSDSEISNGEFKKGTLTIKVSIGMTKNLTRGNPIISEIIVEHDEISTSYVENQVKPLIIIPINEFLSQL
jgi:hypothetical protein